MEKNEQIAMRVRELRTQKGLTVQQMAEILGVTVENYQTYEDGTKQAPFSFYYNVAEYFGLDVSSVISGEESNLAHYTVTRDGEGFPFVRRPGFSYLHQAIRMKERTGEPFIVTAPCGKQDQLIQYSEHNGQEFDLIISGTLKVFLDGKEEILNQGDSIYFDGRDPHAMTAISPEGCKFLSIVMHGKNDDASKPDRFAMEPKKAPDTNKAAQRHLLYQEYMDEEWNEDSTLKKVSFKVPDNFNFAYDVLKRLADQCPDKIAMRWLSKNQELHDFTFREISDNAMRTANLLHSMGVRRGDRVMLVLKRHYQFWYVLNALHILGAVAVPASCQMTAHDFEYRFKKANIKYIFASADGNICNEIDGADYNGMRLKFVVNGKHDGWLNYDELYPNFKPDFPRAEEQRTSDPMLIFFSSGTTGYPKMVEHDYAYPLGHIMTARHWHKVNPDGLHFTIADTGWGKALWGKIYGQWLCEAGVFTYDFDRFHAAEILPMFKKFGITTFCAPPTIFRFMVKEDIAQYDFSTLEHVTTAGEAMPAEVSEAFARVSGQLPYEGFGQTETTLTIGTLSDMKPCPGSMGKANPQYDVILLDEAGKPVKTGETGEICIKADDANHPCGLFKCYMDAPDDTKAAWHDGYYHTGDQAWQDEKGYFWYQGRADDIIKTSGYRVGPFEVESVLMELPYILECAVTGVPDPTRGKVVKATVVLVKGKEPSDQLATEIKEYVKTHTAPYKYPRIIEFVSELPKTVNGKIRRAAIRAKS
ncbi:MAG: AMP-binding protein [Victivallales bacterium]|nr:AMP-binding protein [Victivallales bacterium]